MTTTMTTEAQRIEQQSILGDLHRFYAVKTQEGGGILDEPLIGKVEMYPAGYTKPSSRDGKERQEYHKILYEAAVSRHKETELFPFGLEGHNVGFVHDPNNQYDRNALHLILFVSDSKKSGLPMTLNGIDLGFVPKKINTAILKNLHKIHGGRILKVKAGFHNKYWSAKIVLGYGNTTFSMLAPTDHMRFSGILEE